MLITLINGLQGLIRTTNVLNILYDKRRRKMTILTITYQYPYKQSNDFIFVKQLMDEFVVQNENIIVISPQSLTSIFFKRKNKKPYKSSVIIGHKSYNVFCPNYLTFSNLPILKELGRIFFKRAVLRIIKKEKITFDIIYAHFLKVPGTTAYKIHRKYQKPYFIALGESTFDFKMNNLIINTLKHSKGFITVSTEMRLRVLKLAKYIPSSKFFVSPNGYNPNRFYLKNKIALREKMGINEGDFVIIFVGGFIHRKGTLRLNEALKMLNNPQIKVIFIGKGPEIPDYTNIIYLGTVLHDELNDYLNVSDVFVLPTINEGSCNAIIEALAVGLPIISSNQSFNDDLLDDSYSIRIDSMSVVQIKDAILTLYDDNTLRKNMSLNALIAAKKFTLNDRATNIINFIKSK